MQNLKDLVISRILADNNLVLGQDMVSPIGVVKDGINVDYCDGCQSLEARSVMIDLSQPVIDLKLTSGKYFHFYGIQLIDLAGTDSKSIVLRYSVSN